MGKIGFQPAAKTSAHRRSRANKTEECEYQPCPQFVSHVVETPNPEFVRETDQRRKKGKSPATNSDDAETSLVIAGVAIILPRDDEVAAAEPKTPPKENQQPNSKIKSPKCSPGTPIQLNRPKLSTLSISERRRIHKNQLRLRKQEEDLKRPPVVVEEEKEEVYVLPSQPGPKPKENVWKTKKSERKALKAENDKNKQQAEASLPSSKKKEKEAQAQARTADLDGGGERAKPSQPTSSWRTCCMSRILVQHVTGVGALPETIEFGLRTSTSPEVANVCVDCAIDYLVERMVNIHML